MREQINFGKRWGRRLFVGTLTLGVAVGAYLWGRNGALPEASARPMPSTTTRTMRTEEVSPVPSGRVVAYIHGNIPITREELGEYLIARYGKEKVKLLINKRVIEHAAKAKGIEVSDAEVRAAFHADAKASGAGDDKKFADAVLKRYNKSAYEWQEDVIKPRLIMERMSRARVNVTREDLGQAFEAHYGDKVDCKMILFPKDEEKEVMNKVYPAVRDSDKDFDYYAKMQASPTLAAAAGHIKPVGRHTTGSEQLEKVLFSLRPGEVSHVLGEPEGLVILKCIARIPMDTSVTFEQVKPQLEKEVFDKKVAMEIGNLFRELYAAANVNDLLNPLGNTIKDVQTNLGIDPAKTNNNVPQLHQSLPGVPTDSKPVPPATH